MSSYKKYTERNKDYRLVQKNYPIFTKECYTKRVKVIGKH